MNEPIRITLMRHALGVVFLLLFAFAAVQPARAEPILIRLGTVAPAGSTWHQYLQELDAEWRLASDGRVGLKVYAGTLGGEDDIVRRMRIGQIDAAAITTSGLSAIDDAGRALRIPLAFSSYEELDYVQDRIAPLLEEALHARGIVVLNWGDAGWVRFFTGSPVRRPGDLRQEKLFVWKAGGVSAQEQLWKQLGFHPVPLSMVDIIPALQTGMVTAYQAPPIAALASQWFPFTGSMTDLRWAPLTGATVITTRAWARIPPELRPVLRERAQVAGARLRESVRQLERDAIAAMVKRGLQVIEVPADARREWEDTARAVYPQIRGNIVPAIYFDEVLRLRDEFRARRTRAGTATD